MWVLLISLVDFIAPSWIVGITDLVVYAFLLFLLMRFGFVAFVLAFFAQLMLSTSPITFDASAWYSGYGFAALAIFAVIVLYAFRTSLGVRPLLAASHLDD